jgi:hypothetical protein
MASIPCTIQLAGKTASSPSRWRSPRAAQGGGGAAVRTPLPARRMQGWSLVSKVAPARGSGRVGFFKFGNKDAEGAGIYGSQGRDDFDRDDVEQVNIPSHSLNRTACYICSSSNNNGREF